MAVESGRCSCGVVFEGRLNQAYNEEAFRYFLAIERKRAERSRRSFFLLLVSLRKVPGMSGRIPPVVAARIFSGLWLCVREVDFIGWFREDLVAGAVLTQGAQSSTPGVASRLGQRITDTLCRSVPSNVARRLHVRLLQLRPPRKS
jgi:hypothetical protein